MTGAESEVKEAEDDEMPDLIGAACAALDSQYITSVPLECEFWFLFLIGRLTHHRPIRLFHEVMIASLLTRALPLLHTRHL